MYIEPVCSYLYATTSTSTMRIHSVSCLIDISAWLWFGVLVIFLLGISILWRR